MKKFFYFERGKLTTVILIFDAGIY